MWSRKCLAHLYGNYSSHSLLTAPHCPDSGVCIPSFACTIMYVCSNAAWKTDCICSCSLIRSHQKQSFHYVSDITCVKIYYQLFYLIKTVHSLVWLISLSFLLMTFYLFRCQCVFTFTASVSLIHKVASVVFLEGEFQITITANALACPALIIIEVLKWNHLKIMGGWSGHTRESFHLIPNHLALLISALFWLH